MEKSLKIKKKKEHTSPEKLLFTGLDNGGKTSIIKILQNKISQIAIVTKPTRAAQRGIFKYLGKEISDWDLGGQEKYRIAYLKEPTKYFDNSSVCIYVIDIQDKKRVAESLSYFSDVIKEFRKLGISPLIYVLFHKSDPDYVKENKLKFKGFISELKINIKKIIQNEFELTYTNSSIFNLWTIISIFSQILLKIFPQSELLDKTINQFAQKIDAISVIVLDHNSLVIGDFEDNEDSKQLLQNSTPYFLSLHENLDSIDKAKKMVIKQGRYNHYIEEFNITKAEEPLFVLITIKKEKTFPNEDISSFIEILKSILE